MTMPIDLVLVRHGQSEGNLANNRSRDGDNSDFTPEFLAKHSSKWRLTDLGREQAIATGRWIRANISKKFERCYASEYIRAMETGAYLDLMDPDWYVEFNLRERDSGDMDVITQEDRKKFYGDFIERLKKDPFLFSHPNGESMARMTMRLRILFDTLHRECEDKKVIVVCHGEVMWGFRVLLERMLMSEYRRLDESKHPHDRIHNGQVLHYTRRNPDTGELTTHLNWMRSTYPYDLSLSKNEWVPIERKRYTNIELLGLAESVPRTIAK
jgi:NAD+ kinase